LEHTHGEKLGLMDVKEIKPITPQEVEEAKKNDIPSFVIEAVNKLLKKKWDGKKAIITQHEIISEIKPSNVLGLENGVRFRAAVLSNHWLDFEDLYRKSGWKVEYDKSGYCETYDAYFKFTKK
jgi:hypothetical protein